MEHDWYPILSRLNWQQLLSFLLVAQEKSFRAAASRMHLSQSAVSVQIQQLESLLGVALFHRTTRSVSLTTEGSALVEVAERVARELHAVSQDLRAQASLQRGTVRVAALPTFAHAILPDLMSRYMQSHSGVEIRLIDLDSVAALQALENREVDFAVLGRAANLDPFEFAHLFDDELIVLAPATSSILNKREKITIADLAQERLLLTPQGAQVRTLVDAMFERLGFRPKVFQECYRPQTLLAMVKSGLGVTVLPRSAVAGIGLSAIRMIELKTKHVREVGVVTRRRQSLSPAARSFRDFLFRHAVEQPNTPQRRRRSSV